MQNVRADNPRNIRYREVKRIQKINYFNDDIDVKLFKSLKPVLVDYRSFVEENRVDYQYLQSLYHIPY